MATDGHAANRWGFFGRPASTGGDLDHRGFALHYLSNTFLILTVVNAPIVVVPGHFNQRHLLATVALGLTSAAARLALHRGATVLGGILLAGATWAAAAAMLAMEGWSSPTTQLFFLAIVTAAATIGPRGIVPFTAATLVAVLTAGLAEYQGWTTPVPYSDPSGMALGWTSMCTGLGLILYLMLRSLERALHSSSASEQKLADMIRESPDGLVLLDMTGTAISFSPAIERITGYAPSDLEGRKMLDLPFLDDAGRAEARENFARARERGGAEQAPAVYHIIRADGTPGAIEISRRMVVNNDGSRLIEAAVRDVSARVEADLERKELEAQLRHAQRLESIGRLAGGVAHEFNNCLTAIQGGLAVIESSLDFPTTLDDELRMVQSAADRAAGVTRQLLSFSRRSGAEPVVVSVHGELDSLREVLSRAVGEDVRISMELGAENDRIRLLASGVSQVVMNLAFNARDAMDTGGALTITTRNEGEMLVLGVRDTGPGIPEDVRAHIFEPFFTTKDAASGTGLGLSVVHGIVTGAGGTIELDTSEDGTELRISWPTTDEPLRSPPRAEAVSTPSNESQRHREGVILVVDDDDAVGRATRLLLESENHQVLLARSGDDAVEKLDAFDGRLDLLLTDVVLPGERGPDIARRVTELCPDARVLYMTGYAGGAIDEHGIGESQILAKPFSPTQLFERIQHELRARPHMDA